VEEKKSIDPINLNRLAVLTGFRQRMVIAEKINEIINKLNLDYEPSNN
jgi:hypothetical protein